METAAKSRKRKRRVQLAAHLGIELSPGICRIIDAEVRRGRDGMETTRVRRFSVLSRVSDDCTAALAALRGRRARVLVWGAPGDHRQVMVTAGGYESMRLEARRALSLAGVETRGAMIDIAPAPVPIDADSRRPVVVALANGAAVRAAVAPLRAAGIDITAIATPAATLASLARARRHFASRADEPVSSPAGPGLPAVSVDAWVAIEESATCIALLRDGALVAARELSWGFLAGRRGEPRRVEDIASRLIDECAAFITSAGGSMRSVRQMTLCGGATPLRTVAAIVRAQFGIDVLPLHAPLDVRMQVDDEQAAQCADMWMAWATAVDSRAQLSLLRLGQRRLARTRLARAAVAAGIAAGVIAGYEAVRPLLRAVPAAQRVTGRRALDVPLNQVVFKDE